jgi:predicted metalloprotease with PDZ domain
MLNKLVFLITTIAFTTATSAMNYTVSFNKVKSHYVTVKMDFEVKDQAYVDFKVPVWTPGSYKVREFSNAYENVNAGDLEVTRVDKNTWRVNTENAKQVSLTYEVYCFTVSVRQSYADENYAYLHGVSAFGYIDGKQEEQIVLSVLPNKDWSNVEVALPQTKAQGFIFTCDNYDLLADSPIAIGNFDTDTYESGGVPHKIVMIGKGNYDLSKVTSDFKKISDSEVEMMGDHPSPQYVHFVYNVGSGGGGLEHLNSQCSMISRWAYSDEQAYKRFLALIAHEYFHLWNVKRIRPEELGPFEYDKENYTEMLWIVEGITSYYDDLTMYRAGYYSLEEYLKIISSQINRYENTPGKTVMTLAESSKLAWVKGYMPKAESVNTEISYYNKGMLAALLLDLEIRKTSNKSLDHVMRVLYNDFYKKANKGFSHQEFIEVCNSVAGRDLASFFMDVIYSTKDLDYASVFKEFGIDVRDMNSEACKTWSGMVSKVDGGKVLVSNVIANSPTVEAGLSVNDELIAINEWRITDKFENEDSKYEVNDVVKVTYSRDGVVKTTDLTFKKSPKMDFSLSVLNEDNKKFKAWLF